jgi:transcriptional regulator with XRE-family HTH domain
MGKVLRWRASFDGRSAARTARSFFQRPILLTCRIQMGSHLGFGDWLAARRVEAGMTQHELAKKCALSPAYFANLERSASEPPSLRTCKAVARALGISWDEVWQRAFAGRPRRWLEREGLPGISEAELVELTRGIQSVTRRSSETRRHRG